MTNKQIFKIVSMVRKLQNNGRHVTVDLYRTSMMVWDFGNTECEEAKEGLVKSYDIAYDKKDRNSFNNSYEEVLAYLEGLL